MLNYATFAVALLPIIATALAWRTTRNRILFFVVTFFVFVGIQDALVSAYHVIVPATTDPHADATKTLYAIWIANVLSAACGGLVAFRLWKALRTQIQT